jgi:hypothetical protein
MQISSGFYRGGGAARPDPMAHSPSVWSGATSSAAWNICLAEAGCPCRSSRSLGARGGRGQVGAPVPSGATRAGGAAPGVGCVAAVRRLTAIFGASRPLWGFAGFRVYP